jgi:hypothetical protein
MCLEYLLILFILSNSLLPKLFVITTSNIPVYVSLIIEVLRCCILTHLR